MLNVSRLSLRIMIGAVALIVSACNPLASKNSVDANFNPGLGTSTNATIAIVPLISFTAPTNGSFVNAATDSAVFPVLGNCDQAGAVVTVKLDGSTIASPVCTGVSFSTTMNTTGLAISAHTLTASVTNNSGTSTASSSFSRDLTAPAAAATALGWVQTSPWNSPTASWTLSVAPDIGNQKIQYYTGGACGATSGGLVDVGSATATTSVFSSGVDATTYTYKVITYDAAGNSITSVCSSAMVIDKTVPSVSVTSLNSGGTYAGGSSQTITYTATDTNLGATPITLKYSLDNGTNYTNIVANQANSGTYSWTLPAANSTQVRVQVYVVDQAGNIGTATTTPTFTIDSVAPTLTASAMSLNGGSGTTANNYLSVNLQSSDNLTNITHFCLKYNDTVAPVSTAPCWIAVNAPSPGLTPSTSLNLSSYSYGVGFAPATYNVYAWIKDAAGNISTLTNAGAGTAGQDKATIVYAPGVPGVITDILVASNDAPSAPQSAGDLTIPSASTAYIKWKITDDKAIPTGSVSLYYTTDDSNYTLIASGLDNAQNGGGCTVNNGGTTADDNDTGCYTWIGGSPANTYYKVRVKFVDSDGLTTFSSSQSINVATALNIIAGNTDPGLNGSASAAVFFPENYNMGYSDPGSLVVASDGRIFYRDIVRGLLMVSPADGVQKLIIPTTGTASGDGGSVASATLREPIRLAIDSQDRVLIFDYDRIRRVDTSTNPMTINTLIGGGASSADGVTPLNVAMTYPGTAASQQGKDLALIVAPNGDIYFNGDNVWGLISAGWRLRVYKPTTGLVTSIYPTGTGGLGNAGLDITTCRISTTAMMFDPVTSAITKLNISNYSSAPCVGNYNITLDPTTGVSTGPHMSLSTGGSEGYAYKHFGKDGNLYAFARFNAIVRKYNSVANTWTAVLGNTGFGQCADGTAATSCWSDLQDVFVNAQGVIYFVDRGRIRIVDASGNVQTIMGQSLAFGDGGNALSARFSSITNLDRRTSGEVIVIDSNEYRFREISATGIVSTIAGDGKNNVAGTATSAAAQSIRPFSGYADISDDFAINPANGDVYFNRNNNIAKLNRATDRWVDLMGGGATSYATADGLVGSAIATNANQFPKILGFDGTNLMAFISDNATNSFYKLYTVANGTQSSLAGTVNGVSTFCADGTNSTSCQVPGVGPGQHIRASYDSFASPVRWAVMRPGTNAVRGLQIGSTMQTITTLAVNANSFTYRHDASNNIVYYCGTSDFKIHKKDITGATDVVLSWPIATMKCTGKSMVYNSGTNRLIFPFTQNGLSGVAEYINP